MLGSNGGSALIYPVRFRVIVRYFGELCLVLAALTLVPVITSLWFSETSSAWRYALVFAVYFTLGITLSRLPAPRRMQANEGMVVVVFGFLFACFLTAFPIMGKNFTFFDAMFETISSISTTGLSTLPSVATATSSFLFQRAWMEWYGSLGFITLCMVLLVQSGLTSKVLGGGDSEGNDLVGGAKAHAHRVVKVLFIMSVVGTVGAWILGLDIFNSIVFALTSVATGGLSPTDSGVGGLSWPLQIWISLLCFLGAIPLTIYYRLRQKSSYVAADLLQIKALLITCAIVTIALVFCTSLHTNMKIDYILHNVPLLAIQTQTTSGFTTLSCVDLDAGSKLILICSMLIGGCVGSTAGGIKLLRLLILFSVIKSILQRVSVSRHAISVPKFAGLRLESENIVSALILILMLAMVIILSWLVFLIMGYNPIDSLFEVVSATTNVGISVGITNANLPKILKTILCIDMMFGRLEVIAFLIVLFPGTWFGRRKEES